MRALFPTSALKRAFGAGPVPDGESTLKTKFSFSKNYTSLLLATATLLLLSMQSGTFADDGTWASAFPTDWNTNGNWLPVTGYPGTTAGNTATFSDLSPVTSLFVSATPANSIAAITFTALETHFLTITVNPAVALTISGTGITNSSGHIQNFVTAVDGSGGRGVIVFTNKATAGSMTAFTNNGGTVSGAFAGVTLFGNTSTAGSATLIANGGTAAGAGGGSIQFFDGSTGGTASVDVENNGTGEAGFLGISAHSAPGVTIGSLEGSGNVFLGANNLTVGSNNLSKTFSGVIQDGGFGTGGSLTKTGTGAFTLTGANTYTGGTTVNAGSLFVNNTSGSGTGTGNVTVTAIGADIGTLGGNGTISGLVTVNGGATLAPGPTGNGSTGILNTGTLTLNSDSNFSLDLNGPLAGTNYDQVDVTGEVFITGSNLLINTALGLAVGDQLFILENDGIDPITGTFAGLANGATFSSGGDTFQIFYDANGQGGGNDIELSVTAVPGVPEPSTWVAGALAFVALAYTQRRRFAQMLRRK